MMSQERNFRGGKDKFNPKPKTLRKRYQVYFIADLLLDVFVFAALSGQFLCTGC